MKMRKLKRSNESRREFDFRGRGIVISGQEVTEQQVFEKTFEQISKVNLNGRVVDLPGMKAAKGLIEGAVKEFARNEVESNIEFQPLASVDDAVMQPIRPETFGYNTFRRKMEPGEGYDLDQRATLIPIIQDPEEDFELGKEAAEHSDLDDEWVIITDIIQYYVDVDLIEEAPNYGENTDLTAIQFTEIDGDRKNPEELRAQIITEDAIKVYPLDSPELIEQTVAMNGKIDPIFDTEEVEGGYVNHVKTHIVPVGVHLAEGSKTDELHIGDTVERLGT